MKRILLASFFGSAALFIAVSSCKKGDADTDTTSSTDNSLCEGEFNRVVPEANGIAIGDPGVNDNRMGPNSLNSCPVDSIDPADTLDGYPVTMYIKYGSGCQCADGKTRKGTLRCVFDTAWDSPNPTMTMYLENYYVNNIHFEGTLAVTKNTANRTFTQTMTDGRCSKSTWDIRYNCTRTVAWTSGYNTPADFTDDVYQFTGSADGIDRNGVSFTVQVTTPIEKRGNCQYITKGVFELTPDGKDARIVDFGDGTCDNRATLKIGNSTFNFTLL
jgi:hypothetical protein